MSYKGAKMEQSLNDLMEFNHVVLSDGTGYVTDRGIPNNLHAPDGIYGDVYDGGPDVSVERSAEAAGWQVFSKGYTSQQGGGYIMHDSEAVGSTLEHDIRHTPGYYVACVVSWLDSEDDKEETCIEGWVVLRKELETS